MEFFRNNPPSKLLRYASLLGLILAVGATRLANFDIWWHLKTGEIITKWGQIPNFDIFSYTASGNPWMNHEWLFQIIGWNLFEKFNIAAFTSIKLIATIGIAIAVYRTIKSLTKSDYAALWGSAFILISIADRIMARPFLATLFFLAFFLMQLHKYVANEKKSLWLLPPLTIIWINLHAGGLLAPQLIIAFALGESLHSILKTKPNWQAPSPIDSKKIRHLWTIGALCICACAITPHGIQTIIFPISHLGMGNILANTQEWLPALDPRLDGVISQILFRIVLIITPIAYIVNRKSVRLSHLLLTILTAFLLFQGKRFTPHFILVNIPIIFFNFREIAKRIPLTKGAENLRAWGSVLTIAMISMLAIKNGIPATTKGGLAGDMGFGTTRTFASGTADFLELNDIHGRSFNEMGIGGYLIFKRWPGERVFIDGRTPVFGDDFYAEYVNSMRHSRNFENLDKKYNFDYLVFNAYQAWNLRHMHRFFWDSEKWHLIYANSNGLIYLKDIPRFKSLIDRYALKKSPIVEEMKKAGEILELKGNDIKK